MNTDVREPSAKYLLQMDFQPSEIGPIPRDWTLSTVGAEFNVQLGKMLDAERNVGIEKPYLGNKAVQWGRVEVSETQTMRMSRADLEKFRLQSGDLLVCEGGEVGRAAIWDAPLIECYYQKALHRLRPIRGYEPRLMLAVLQLWASRGVLANYVTQTSIAHLPKEKFVAVPIPRPTPDEQRAIATALSDVDALIAGLERLFAKKRNIKQAAMQQLLTGQTRLPGFSGAWTVKRLGDVGHCLRGVAYRGDADLFPHDTEQTKRLLRSNNVQDAMVVATDVQFVNAACVSEHQILRAGDVLICMANGSKSLVGKAGYFDREDGFEYTFGAFMGVFRRADVAERRFVFYLFQTGRYRDYINNLLAGSSINNLSPASVMSLEFSFPAKEEQTAIATVLFDMDTDLSALEARLAKTRAIKQGMMQELLTGRTRLV
ncbi:MAG: restriction endonuclease subunit S [Hydrogenophaga sp.]|uniref:restriction endonuclease subunit S n=1 Tax=Hydrogenophaga sp. TaxID=1904254 RepID=UPI0027192158|nr:restriction endonuclease subunit S [Hydrogenophaga sp.]MDO9571664.1 restriction endonuclease subunit S [Hydrogenophaga sp.]MDP3374566.1 restriction endonuclease subunit S [Hydrogenophaga sp.]